MSKIVLCPCLVCFHNQNHNLHGILPASQNQVFQYSTQFPQDSCLKILVQAVIQGSIVSAAAMEYDAARTEEEPCGTVTKMMGKTERAKTPTWQNDKLRPPKNERTSPQKGPLRTKIIFQPSIFRWYVSFQGVIVSAALLIAWEQQTLCDSIKRMKLQVSDYLNLWINPTNMISDLWQAHSKTVILTNHDCVL